MNIEELLPSKDVIGMDVIVTDEISTSDNDANLDTNKNIVTNEYVDEDLSSDDSSLKSASGKRKNESEYDNPKKRIKTVIIRQDISGLVNEEIDNDGILSESLTQNINYISDRSEYIEKDISSSNTNCEDSCGDRTNTFPNNDDSQTNTEIAEPNQNPVIFKSFYVRKDSKTPYSDATSSVHDPEKVKRPMNPFMIFAHYERKKILEHKPNSHNAQISKTLGKKWKTLSKEETFLYKQEAEKLRQFHIIEYPHYRYQPRKKMKKETIPTFLNPLSQSQTVITRAGPISKNSFKINNWFGSNSWINSPVSELCNGRTQSLNSLDPTRLCLKLTIDDNFKATLKNPQHRETWTTSPMKSYTAPETNYYSPAMYSTSNLFSSSDTSSLSGIQTPSIQETLNPSDDLKTSANKFDIHTIIEEFMSEPNPSFNPPSESSTAFFNPSTPIESLYPTPPSTPLDFNELLLQDQQQFDHQWDQQLQFYHSQQLQSNEVLWHQQYQPEHIDEECIQNVNEEHINQSFTQIVNEEHVNQSVTQNVDDEHINQSFTHYVNEEHINLSVAQNVNEEHNNQSFTCNVNEEHANQNLPQNVKVEYINQRYAENVNKEHVNQNFTQNINEDYTNQSFTQNMNEGHTGQDLAQNVKVEYIDQRFSQTLNEESTSESFTHNMNEENASENFTQNMSDEQNFSQHLKEDHMNLRSTQNANEEQSFIQNVKIEFDPNLAKNIKSEYD